MPRLPNFFIAGAPKAGTTSLYRYLDQHPQVYMSPIKEPNYFAAEIREQYFDACSAAFIARENRGLREFLAGPMAEKRFGGIVADWEDYLRLFANARAESVVGEASVCYLWSPTAAARIAEKISHAKILLMLRNPVDRALSQYHHGLAAGAIQWSFRQHVERNLSHRSGQLCVHYPFLEFGLYSQQVERYLKQFGDNVWIGFYEDFQQNPLAAYQSICTFLEVDPHFVPAMSTHYLEAQVPRWKSVARLKRLGVWRAAARISPPSLRPVIRGALVQQGAKIEMDPADREFLNDFYHDDIRRLERLAGRNLSGWLDPRRTATLA